MKKNICIILTALMLFSALVSVCASSVQKNKTDLGDSGIISLYDEPITPIPDELIFVRGDVNLDQEVNAKDVIFLMKHLVGACDLPEHKFAFQIADFNFDGKINAKDVISLMVFIAKS